MHAPSRIALFTIKERLTYGELDAAVDRLCTALHARGVRPGTAVAGFFEKRLTLPLCFLAASRLGCPFVPLNPRLSYPQHKPSLQQISVGAFFTELDHLALLSTLRPLLRPDAPLVVLAGDPPLRGYERLSDLLDETGAPPEHDAAPGDVAYLNFTSGTTGAPKAARATHANLHAATAAACTGLGLTERDVHLCLFAASAHPHELFARAIHLGGTAVIHDSMSPKALANAVEKARVTCMMAVPPLYDVSLRPQLEARMYRMESLRLLEAGGMATPAPLVTSFLERFGLEVVPVWGSTETTGIALRGGGGSAPGLLTGPIPGFEMRIEADDGSPAAPGAAGELVLSGGAVVPGYLGAETPALSDGTFRTGDVVRATSWGIQFVGRRDDMRKVGGLKVFPQELEEHLASHPAIREVAVSFREDRSRGLAPVAFVVPKEGSEPPSLTDVKRHLRGKVPAGTMPRAVELVAALPRTSAGKLDRGALR